MIDQKAFFEAIDELSETRGISKESIYAALKEAMQKAYVRKLGIKHLEEDETDPVVVNIDEKTAKIEMYQVQKVVKDVKDDYLEISLTDAKKKDKDAAIGGEIRTYVDIDSVSKLMAMNVKSVLNQKIREAEKGALYETYKNNIGEMITGVVEKSDDNSTIVNIGRTSVYLSRKELIGEETFTPGQQIRLYVKDVSSSLKGAQIVVTRSDKDFLKRILEEEIHEIYDGTVVIKAIAREAGNRSKVAVSSTDPDVDPVGACIGANGSRIQNVVSQLGNAKVKERIDVFPYTDNIAALIVEAMRPATVIGLILDNENKTATAVIKDEQTNLALGRKGSNIRTASLITDYKITPIEESLAKDKGLAFVPVEQIVSAEDVRKKQEKINKKLEAIKKVEGEHAKQVEVSATPVIEDVKETVTVSPAVEEARVQEETKPEEPRAVKVTTTLEDLEKELAQQKKNKPQEKDKDRDYKKFAKRPRKITDDEVKKDEYKDEEKKNVTKMDIYTEEELQEFEKENPDAVDDSEEDVDYEQYDKYYDDDGDDKK